jgi:hypothetical protein
VKVGDLVCWKTELLYGIVSKSPMVVVEMASLNYDVRIVSPETGWADWACEEELHIVSSS